MTCSSSLSFVDSVSGDSKSQTDELSLPCYMLGTGGELRPDSPTYPQDWTVIFMQMNNIYAWNK